MTPNSIDRELKRMDLEAERRDELLDSELDRVTGGLFDKLNGGEHFKEAILHCR
jgi:hypothetical protein